MKTILLKKQIVLPVFLFFSINLFAQLPTDPGDDPVNTTEATKQSQTIAATEKSQEDINSKESNSTAVFPAASVTINGKKLKKHAGSKNNSAKNSSEKRPSKKRKI
jgi:glycerol-3-phosphate O-acyltransferase